jgi:hypothetical protein
LFLAEGIERGRPESPLPSPLPRRTRAPPPPNLPPTNPLWPN